MQLLDLWFRPGNISSFELAGQPGSLPNIGDYLYYAFGVMTTSGFGDVIPVNFFAKAYTMLTTATSILLLGVFIEVAMAGDPGAKAEGTTGSAPE